jgi:hypothetical protein
MHYGDAVQDSMLGPLNSGMKKNQTDNLTRCENAPAQLKPFQPCLDDDTQSIKFRRWIQRGLLALMPIGINTLRFACSVQPFDLFDVQLPVCSRKIFF